jgi:hypothetical protein
LGRECAWKFFKRVRAGRRRLPFELEGRRSNLLSIQFLNECANMAPTLLCGDVICTGCATQTAQFESNTYEALVSAA